ncbi:MAG: hypothetical protein WBS19_10465 [Candidatus Korobacteraceae bacterium]
MDASNPHRANNFPAAGERRQVVRYPLAGSVRFQWITDDGKAVDAVGITSDIGRGGLFVTIN